MQQNNLQSEGNTDKGEIINGCRRTTEESNWSTEHKGNTKEHNYKHMWRQH